MSRKRGLVTAVKLTLLVAAMAAATILVVQNTEVVEFRLLFWTLSMSRIVLLSTAILLGFLGGFITGTLVRRPGAVTTPGLSGGAQR